MCRNGEIDTLADPKAALLAFCVALVAYNALGVVKGALRAEHGEEVVEEVSTYDVADEIAGTHRGMMIAIPEEEWAVFHDRSPMAMGRVLRDLAGKVRLASFRKQRRGPKRPRPRRESGAKDTHVSTAKLLRNRKKRT